jgi:pantoate--beta-alanine ligase
MEIVETVEGMRDGAKALRLAGHTIALVPTMGFLHEGHLELMRVGKDISDKLIISIFVNPTQFGPTEDFDEYPRDTEGDIAKAREVGVDVVFMPSAREMYPGGFQTKVMVEIVSLPLCGASRPGHFNGVTTVVAKLFNIIRPDIAVFGQKDFQQVAVIKRMVEDLNMDVEIVGARTVRERDGLAMSSRNSNLSPEERKSALCVKKSLDLANQMFQAGEKDATVIKEAVESLIKSYAFTKIDYVSICDPMALEDVDTLKDENLLALAVRVGKTRLIDNRLLHRSQN